MDSIIDSIVDFVRIRQLNIAVGFRFFFSLFVAAILSAIFWYSLGWKVNDYEEKPKPTYYRTAFCYWVAVILTTAYLVYQYWDVITKGEVPHHARPSRSRSRSKTRSRSRSRSYYKQLESNSKIRRGRKPHRRCPDCSLCDFEQ